MSANQSMSDTSIKVTGKTYDKLFAVQTALRMKRGKKVTMDESIVFLFDEVERMGKKLEGFQ